MGFLILIGIGWALGFMFEGKAAEYRGAQAQYRKQLNRKLKQQHPSWDKSRRARSLWWGARRNAAGHFAYQLRHGWSPAVADIRDGFSSARQQHAEWSQRRAEGGEPMPSLGNGIRYGWLRAKAKFQETRSGDDSPMRDTFYSITATGRQDVDGELLICPTCEADTGLTFTTSSNDPRVTGSCPNAHTWIETGLPASAVRKASTDAGSDAGVHRLHLVGAGTPGATSTRGEPMTGTMTGETTNIGTYRAHLDATANAARQRIEEAQAEITAADKEITAHENTNAGLLEAGLGSETAGGMADLMDAAMQRKSAAQTRLQAAEQALANADQAKAKLRTQGHENVEQSVQGATAKVGKTSFYEG
ncbi:MAG: hypothetical protein JWO57_1727 [Pseudonocardiales bacterium]|nr:hypothetical protein [Pseudonocardiales bacterium]